MTHEVTTNDPLVNTSHIARIRGVAKAPFCMPSPCDDVDVLIGCSVPSVRVTRQPISARAAARGWTESGS